MDIKEYMFRQGLTLAALAKLLDCSRHQITLMRAGRKVSEKFARQVERVTKGIVSKEDILNPSTKLIPLPDPVPLYPEEGDKVA